jgi:hypothetical protein
VHPGQRRVAEGGAQPAGQALQDVAARFSPISVAAAAPRRRVFSGR